MPGLETVIVAKTGVVAAKIIAKARIHVVNNSCAQQGPAMKLCVKQFREQLGHDKVYVMTKRAKEIAHAIGHELFIKGKTSISKRLSEVKIKEIPSSYLNQGIDDDEIINFAANVETIKLRIDKVGLEKFCKILFESSVDLLL